MTKRSLEGEAGTFFPDGSDVLAKLRLARYFAKLDFTELALAICSLLLCQCSHGLFPVPLPCLCRSNKCVFVVGIHNARVLSDIRCFQKRLAALVDGDCLKMTESIAHKIDRSAFLRQRL